MSLLYVESLNRALHDLCASDPRVYILGEDILDAYGGAFKVTRGLSTRFPGRVFGTPISEAAIIGLAGGMAMRGLRPVVEIMFGDFLLLSADQLVNHLCKYQAMYAGQAEVGVVIRTPMGAGRGYGPTHSQSLEKFFLGVPNLKVVAPSLFHSPGDLLKTAVMDPNPVLFIESKLLYPLPLITRRSLPQPLSMAERTEDGYPVVVLSNFDGVDADVTLVTYGGMSRRLLPMLVRLAEQEIRVRCAIPSLINRLSAGWLVETTANTTAGCVIWEEGTASFDWGAEVAATLYGAAGANAPPIRRCAAAPTIVPANRTLEALAAPEPERVEDMIISLTDLSLRRQDWIPVSCCSPRSE
ncbi:MAG: transketolase C-terminal domain-containing protein [Bryobacteraceae bacterium]|jgi:pyruvate/2-oxoglutarate/acetoin dehydrogenase E1 component